MNSDLGLPAHLFAKEDPGDDATFYAVPRLVTHIDDAAIAALTRFYTERLRPGDAVLDLMSSWVSHLPDGLALGAVTGHGMNRAELDANPRLTHRFVQDLNRDPALPLEAATFDAVLACVGVQYLQEPLAVFREARRVLRPGGQMIVSFSNRCFPTKAVAAWRALGADGHAALVSLYFERAGFEGIDTTVLCDGRAGDPLVAVAARA